MLFLYFFLNIFIIKIVKTQELPIAQLALIIAKSQTGLTGRRIAREMNISQKTVADIIKKHRETGSFEVKSC